MRYVKELCVAVAAATGAWSQVTAKGTPNAAEYAEIKSDVASYGSALQTESLYLAAQSYVQAHTTSVPYVGVVMYTQSWSEGVKSLNDLITTQFPSSYPTIVAELYHSVLEEQADIINQDMTGSLAASMPLATGTGAITPSSNGSTMYTSSTPTQTSVVVPGSSGAANANVLVNGFMLVLGLGVAVMV